MNIKRTIQKSLRVTPTGLDSALRKVARINGQLTEKDKMRLARRCLFSRDPNLRRAISEDLVKNSMVGYLARVVNKLHAKQFPAEYFKQDYAIARSGGRKIRITDKYFAKELEKGPSFYYRGFPVYESEKTLGHEGMFFSGKIFVEKSLPPFMKRVVSAHEVGEVLSHEAGLLLEMMEVKKRGWEKEFLEWVAKDSEYDDVSRERRMIELAKDIRPLQELASGLRIIVENARLDPNGP